MVAGEECMMISPFHLRETVRLLSQGAVIAYPTEAVYGLGCDPLNRDSVRRILAMKQRPQEKGLILVAADIEQLRPFLLPLSSQQEAELAQSWPGPVTWLIPCRPEVPRWLRGEHDSLAVRVSAHPLVRQLCLAWGGPIVSTSANIGGHPPARSSLSVRQVFGQAVDYILHASLGGAERPTEIRDLLTGWVQRPS